MDGRSVQVALRNLSAQLITGFGLEELAPGGMLPEWAQDPGGFESLLGIAAGRARQEGRGLVLVVDGLMRLSRWGGPAVRPAGAAGRRGAPPRSAVIQLTRNRLAAADRREGRRRLWLSALDRLRARVRQLRRPRRDQPPGLR
jgi:hypothetical protein